jgi:hypothetical protein
MIDSWILVKQNRDKGILYPTVSITTKLPKCKSGEIITIEEPRISAWPGSMYIFDIVVPNNSISGQTITVKTPSHKYIEEYEDFYFKQLYDYNKN